MIKDGRLALTGTSTMTGNGVGFYITGDARTLIGTIYLPRGSLLVDAKQPVAEQSAYTAIIAQSIELNSGPNLILNTNYDSSDVPVPSGIAGSTQVILAN